MKKLEEKVDQVSGKKKFNPAEAFSHHKKENMPLSVLSNGEYACGFPVLAILIKKWECRHFKCRSATGGGGGGGLRCPVVPATSIKVSIIE